MPNPLNRRTGDQWDTCAICGFLFPKGQLQLFKGRLTCRRDVDDLTVELRDREIERLLSDPSTMESSDTRNVDAAFLMGDVESSLL